MAVNLFRLNGFYTEPQKKRFALAMDKRSACRAFSGSITPAQWADLSYSAQRCCLPSARIVLGMCDAGFFRAALLPQNAFTGVERFAALIADTREKHHALLAGISGEAFVLSAAAAGVGTCWVSQSYKKKDSPVRLTASEALLCVIALGPPAADAGISVLSRKRKPVERLVRGGSVAGWPDWALQAVHAVRLAPSHQNAQPWELSRAGDTLFFYGADKQSLENGIAILHAEAVIPARHEWTLGADRNIIAKVTVYGL